MLQETVMHMEVELVGKVGIWDLAFGLVLDCTPSSINQGILQISDLYITVYSSLNPFLLRSLHQMKRNNRYGPES